MSQRSHGKIGECEQSRRSVAYRGNKGRPFRSALPRADYCENYALHCTYYLYSHWLRAYSEFWKSAQPTD